MLSRTLFLCLFFLSILGSVAFSEELGGHDRESCLDFTAFFLVVNASVPEIDNKYSIALSSTVAESLNLTKSAIVVTGSQTQRRRLLNFYIFLAEVEISVPCNQIPSYYQSHATEYYDILQTKTSRFVYSGNASNLFRSELKSLSADFDDNIGVAAFHTTGPMGSYNQTGSTGILSVKASATETDRHLGAIFLVVISVVGAVLLACFAGVVYSISMYCIGLYRWKTLTKSMSGDISKNADKKKQLELSVIVSKTVLDSMSDESPTDLAANSSIVPEVLLSPRPVSRMGIAIPPVNEKIDVRVDASMDSISPQSPNTPMPDSSRSLSYSPPPTPITPVHAPWPPSRSRHSPGTLTNIPLV